jgi:hypothetical protein
MGIDDYFLTERACRMAVITKRSHFVRYILENPWVRT